VTVRRTPNFPEVRQGKGGLIAKARDLRELLRPHRPAASVDPGDVLLLDLAEAVEQGARAAERLLFLGLRCHRLEGFEASPDPGRPRLEVEPIGEEATLAEIA
jgi:hypothetical protein